MSNRKQSLVLKKDAELFARAEKAFRRVAIKVKAENRRFGLKDAVWPSAR